jgi:methyltransferase (TIGR00027 family)
MTTRPADGVIVDAVPSRTSQAVALVRASLPRPVGPHGVADAQARLCVGMEPAPLATLRAHLIARTRFVDDQVLAAIAAGISQVVILGAGYDDRGLRFRSPGIQFYELDHPATQSDKQRRLESLEIDRSGLTLAAVDFRDHDVEAMLQKAGHDARLATLFICEGLLVYLDAHTIVDLLTRLRSRAAPGSRLAASLAIHAVGLDSHQVLTMANTARRNSTTEPWRTILPAQKHLELISRAGWSVTSTVDDYDLEPTAAPGRSLMIVACPTK